jgi:4-amino-4-deoxy-L-arabinose transferase-like glycosyltransferase
MRNLKRRIPVWAATVFCVALILPLAAAVPPNDTARFLSQASLGADWDEIHHVADVG